MLIKRERGKYRSENSGEYEETPPFGILLVNSAANLNQNSVLFFDIKLLDLGFFNKKFSGNFSKMKSEGN